MLINVWRICDTAPYRGLERQFDRFYKTDPGRGRPARRTRSVAGPESTVNPATTGWFIFLGPPKETMVVETESHADTPTIEEHTHERDVIACESAPDRIVLIESGNKDGWIASDVTVELLR